ncbi:MAG: alcohol dehydrogenase catalytic domain-containing protein [Candidatus Sumerlaeia bacterium]|nr:alcohol dehydrogenase catalytic domain-containing protein [Candidatus Sumerlaeia bacterium]
MRNNGQTYRAAVLTAPRHIELRELPLPHLGPNDALIRIHLAGVCGTDLAVHDGDYPVPLPLVLGHEWVGTVEAVGNARQRRWAGRRVVGEINNHCGALGFPRLCAACRAGLPTHCLKRTVTGIVAHDGAFAEYAVVPVANLRALPPAMSEKTAVFIEPLAAALQTFVMTPLSTAAAAKRPAPVVVVLGCGRLGVLVALVAQVLGGKVLAFGRRREDTAFARRVGVRAQIEASAAEILKTVQKTTAGLGADVVVEATGSPEGLALALDCVRPRGTIALKSTPGLAVERFDLTRAVVNEVRLQGSRCGSFSAAIRFWQRHRPPLERLVAAEFPLAQIGKALERAHQPGKVLVRCM